MKKRARKWTFYADAAQEWRWRYVAGNGRIIDDSSEGYTQKKGCWKNAHDMGCPTAYADVVWEK